ARDVLAEVARQHASMDIIAAADAVADHDGDRAAAIEAFDGLGVGGAWEGRRQCDEERQDGARSTRSISAVSALLRNRAPLPRLRGSDREGVEGYSPP